MFVFGVLAVLQVTFIPGMILLKAINYRWRWLQGILLAFGLSLVANYVLAFILVTLRLYLRGVVLSIFVLEVIALLYVYRDVLAQPLEQAASKWLAQAEDFFRGLLAGLVDVEDDRPLVRFLVGAVSLILVLYAFSMVWWGVKVFFNGVGMVFDQWDAVVSWNRWARSWAGNTFPNTFGSYPQLIPLNLSMVYVFMGGDRIQFFGVAVMSMFTGAILLLLLDLAFQHKRVGFFAAIIAAQFILKEFTGNFINTAYVDIPLAFFAFAAFYAAYQAKQQPDLKTARPYVWASALLAAGAAVTKQPGFWILGFVALFLFFVVLPMFGVNSWKDRINTLLLPFGIAALVVLPWYIYVEIGIFSGRIQPNMDVLTDTIYGDKTRLEIFIDAFRSLGVYAYALLVVLLGSAWLDKVWRWTVYGIVLPYSLIWAALFSYEPRNLAMAFGFWALAIGLVLEKLLVFAGNLVEKLRLGRLRTFVLPVLFILLLALGGVVFTDGSMVAQHDAAQRTILDKKLNSLIYDYFDELGTVEPIISSYPIHELPGLMGIQMSFRNQAAFNQEIADYPDVHYLLMPQTADDALKEQILGRVDAGEYELLFHQNRYYFIHILP